MKKFLVVLSAVFVSVFMFSACKFSQDYALSEGFYRLMSVERRATVLKNLNNDVFEDKTVIATAMVDSEGIPRAISVNKNENYDVLIVTDLHFGNENSGKNGPRREREWFEAITKKDESGIAIIDNVKFVICLGDVAEHGYRGEYLRYNRDVVEPLEALGIPVYNILGNHDLYNSGWNGFSGYMYPFTSFYKFETPEFSWYFLDSASGSLGGYQYDTLERDMKEDNKKKLVFSHVPLYADDFLYFTMQNTEERNKIISTCATNSTRLFIDGHTHKDRDSDFGKFKEKNLPGFLEKYGYGILHINEENGTAAIESKYY